MDESEHGSRAGGTSGPTALLHASAVAVGERGVLILGAAGSGKSGLVLRLLALGALLVADDRVVLRRDKERLLAAAPPPLAGLVEARGVGLIRLPALPEAKVALIVDLDHAPETRMPQRRKTVLLDRELDLIYGHGVPNLDAIIMVLLHTGGVVE